MHPNEALVCRGYEAFTTGDFETTLWLMSPDIKRHVGGRHAVSGDHEGRDGVHGFFGELFKITAGSFRIDVHDVLASPDHAVVLGTMTGTRGPQEAASAVCARLPRQRDAGDRMVAPAARPLPKTISDHQSPPIWTVVPCGTTVLV